MSLTPHHGYFGRQQDVFDPMCPPPHPFNFPMAAASPREMHSPLPLSLPLPPPPPPMMAISNMNRIEYEETPDAHLYRVRLPAGKEDARVRVEEGRVLHISVRGADKREERKEERGYYRMESSFGEFESRMRLPDDAKVDCLRTFVKDGLLTVAVPRDRLHNVYAHRNY